jgi:hypothetical protein
MNWPPLPDLDFGQSVAVDPSQFTAKVSHRDLDDTAGLSVGHVVQLDYAAITANHALTASEADITGLETDSFQISPDRPRRLRVRAHLLTSNTTAGGRNKFNLKTTGGTYLDEQNVDCVVAGDRYRVTLEWQGTISLVTGFEVRGLEITGAGQVDANTAYPAFIEVQDLGVLT